MGNWMSVTDFLKNANPQPGDMIQFNRAWYYKHWAMMSHLPGYVFNICAEGKDKTTAWIRLELLRDVANGSKIQINNKTHLRLEALTGDEAVAEAKKVLNTQVPYDFKNNNCEYYVTKWKYGHGWSDQVKIGFELLSSISLMFAELKHPSYLHNLEIENPSLIRDREIAVDLKKLAALCHVRASQHDVSRRIPKSLKRLQNNDKPLVSKKKSKQLRK